MHPNQRRREQRVPKATHGKKFSHALQHAQKNQKPKAHASILLCWKYTGSRKKAVGPAGRAGRRAEMRPIMPTWTVAAKSQRGLFLSKSADKRHVSVIIGPDYRCAVNVFSPL
jgi:hypothetical protein